MNQDPHLHLTGNKGGPRINTLMKKNDIIMSTIHQRWLTPMEKLAVMGFPVFVALRSGVRGSTTGGWQCSFDRDRAEFGMPRRHRNAVAGQAGNGMVIQSVGTCLLWIIYVAARANATTVPSTNAILSALAMSVAAARQDVMAEQAEQTRKSPAKALQVERADETLSKRPRLTLGRKLPK